MKLLICTLLALLLLPAATFQQEHPAPEEPPYTIRVTSAEEGAQPVIKVLKLEVEGTDARQFTQKATPFDIKIDSENFEAEFQVVSEDQRAEVELLGEESDEAEEIVLRAISDGRISLRHHENPGGVISAWDDSEE